MNILLTPFLSGLVLGGSLIIAIGSQNAFILRMGLLRSHVFILCLICSLSDAFLASVGVAGLGAFVDRNPALLTLVSLGGGLFLLAYAVLAAWRAFSPHAMRAANESAMPLGKAVGICLAFTFLNPHVYLDMVVLIGALATAWPGEQRLAFAIGAVSASFIWFFGLGYGARLLEPLFKNPMAWRILDAIIALVMAWLGISLLLPLIG